MKKTALPIALLAALALGACGEKPASTETSPSAPPQAAAPADEPAEAIEPGAPLLTPMPQGVGLAFPYHFRADKTQVGGDGLPRRVVRIEVLEPNLDRARQAVYRDLHAAGFRRKTDTPATTGNDGTVREVFIKKGWKGSVTVGVVPVGDREPQNMSAAAFATYVWYGDGVGGASTDATAEETAAARAPEGG